MYIYLFPNKTMNMYKTMILTFLGEIMYFIYTSWPIAKDSAAQSYVNFSWYIK